MAAPAPATRSAPSTTPLSPDEQPTLSQHMREQQRADLEEQFDQDGNAIKVGNLQFVEGILGTGAYGTVRLARRTLTPPPSRSSTPDTGHSASERKRLRKQQNRRANFSRSFSAPSDRDLFREPLEKSASSIVGELFASPSRKKENPNEQLVAVKIFNKSILKRMRTMERDKTTHKMHVKTAFDKVEREIALMKKLSHPNLVALYDVIDSPESDNLYMVIEYMPLGEILTYQDDGTFARKPPPYGKKQIDGVVNGHYDEAHAALFFVDILHALGYLHQHHICHRDLKPENILLDARGVVKISDFGVSHFFEDEQNVGHMRRLSEAPQHHPTKLTRLDTDSALEMTGLASTGLLQKTEGTWCFWSPEMCSSSSYFSGYAADMWAAGVCLYIFVTGKLPFFSEVPTELFDMIAEADVPYKGLGLSNALIDLLQMTLEKDPTKRAGVGDCLKHPFLQVARTTRIRQLSEELAQSRNLSTALQDEDVRKAFRIVTTFVNPSALLKNAQKHLQDGFQTARERLSMGGSTFSSSSSLVGMDDEKQGVKVHMKKGESKASSSSSTPVGSDDEHSNKKPPPTTTNKWCQKTKRAAYQRVGGGLSSFDSTGSESSASMGPTSHSSRLFPIPQNRVMTESSRNMSLGSNDVDLNLSLTERTSNMSGGEMDDRDGQSSLDNAGTKKESQSPSVEKRASELSADEAKAESNGSPKRLRSKPSKEQCTIQ